MRDRRQHRRIACLGAAILSAVGSVALGQPPHTPGQHAPAPALRPYHLNFKHIEIPFSVDSTGQPPVEVQLYVSRDAGSQWDLFASQPSSGKPFLFEASAEGDYWFATRTVDQHGNAAALRPQLAVRVDTTDPLVDLQATLSPTGSIALTLLCIDAAPSVDSIRVEYSVDQTEQWTLVSDLAGRSEPGHPDRLHATAEFLPPQPWHQISIRALVGDLAGNKTIVTRQVDKPRIAAGQMRLATSKAASNGSSTLPPAAPALTSPPPIPSYAREPAARVAANTPWAIPQFSVSSGAVATEQPAAPAGVLSNDPAAAASGPELTAPVNSQSPLPAASPLPNPSPIAAGSPVADPQIPLTPASPPPRPKTAAEAMRPLVPTASSAPPANASSAAAGASPRNTANPPPPRSTPIDPRQSAARVAPAQQGQAANSRPLPSTTDPSINSDAAAGAAAYANNASVPTRHSRSRKFSLEYEIESAGLAGVSDVELWGTTDFGQTWKRWGADPDRESPFDIETNNDGNYGFRIVVVANNGLATPRPLSREPADMMVVVDTQTPRVRITGASYGDADQTGSLVIRYQCDDANLMQRPISLSFSGTPEGPWSTIAAGLENEGGYVWPADPNLPRQIYLRIDAIDMAGNAANYVLDTPIDIQGLAPRARIRGFNPLTGSAGGVPRNGAPRAAAASAPAQTAAHPTARFK